MNKVSQKMLIYFLCLVSLVINIKNTSAATINEGDLIKSKTSSSIYLIQNGKKRIFPHSSVYLSWGYPSDYSVVKTVTDNEVASYEESNPVVYRDGFVFRFEGVGMPGGFDPSAVFFVSDGKVRPIESATAYMELFNGGEKDSKIWDKVYWIPKDLLSKFAYEKGDTITSAQIKSGELPNGLVVKTSTGVFSVVKDGKLNEMTTDALFANRYLTNEKIFEKMVAPKIDPVVLTKINFGNKITDVDADLLTVKNLDFTIVPQDNTDTTDTGNENTTTNNGSSPTAVTPNQNSSLTLDLVAPLAKPVGEDPFALISVEMANDSDRIINISFNKDVQNTSARNRSNYTFKKVDGVVLNSITGGNRIDYNGHPLVTPVRNYSDNKKVSITLGSSTEDKSAIPSGSYQLCISNIKTSTGGNILPTTCKTFNVMGNIRPTLYSNSDSFELNTNYIASNRKILIRYSEVMGNSALSSANYKIRNYKKNSVTQTSWRKLSDLSFYGITLVFKNDSKDVLITFPSNIDLVNGETDFMIGYTEGSISYTPRDANGNSFKETTNNTSSLIGENIVVDATGMDLSDNIEYIEVISTTELDIVFKREINAIDYSEFKIKNINNVNGFSPVSVTIDSEDARKAKFIISTSYGFTSKDIDSAVGIKLSNSATTTTNTKDILGLSINNTGNGWIVGNNQGFTFGSGASMVVRNRVRFISNIGIKIDSFVLADPNNIYIKFDGKLTMPAEDGSDNLKLADDLIIQQGNNRISGKSVQTYNSEYSYKDGLMSVLKIINKDSNNYDFNDDYSSLYLTDEYSKARDTFRLIFSPSLDIDQDVTIRTVKADDISSFGANMANFSEDLNGLTGEKFAAYRIDKGFAFYNASYEATEKAATSTLTINGYGLELKASVPGSYYNGMHINIVDDDTIPCYDNFLVANAIYRPLNTDYSMAGIGGGGSCSAGHSSTIVSKITGTFPNFELKCDINSATQPLTFCELASTLKIWHSEHNINIANEVNSYIDYFVRTSGTGYSTDVTPINEMDIVFSGGVDGYYTVSPETSYDYGDEFLSIRFNKDLDLNVLSSYGDWTTADGISYGLNIPDSLIVDVQNDKITFDNINIGEFDFDGGIGNTSNENLILDAGYIYNIETKTLSINIDMTLADSTTNQDECDNNITNIYSVVYDGHETESKITYIPDSRIKDVYNESISTRFVPSMYVPMEYYNN